MKITRRVFLSSMLYMVSTTALPFELKTPFKLITFKSNATFFNAEEMTLLYDIADIMIPSTDTPGASDSHSAQVLDELMVTWASPNTQQQFKTFLSQFKAKARNTSGKEYVLMSREDRLALLIDIDESAFDASASDFLVIYKRLKALIFHIHYSSEIANPNFFLVPGGYRGSLTQDELNVIYERKYL